MKAKPHNLFCFQKAAFSLFFRPGGSGLSCFPETTGVCCLLYCKRPVSHTKRYRRHWRGWIRSKVPLLFTTRTWFYRTWFCRIVVSPQFLFLSVPGVRILGRRQLLGKQVGGCNARGSERLSCFWHSVYVGNRACHRGTCSSFGTACTRSRIASLACS